MPYIPTHLRQRLDKGETGAVTAGELNYVITKACLDYLATACDGYSYASVNDVIGALECAKLEMYRKVAVPYEDEKCRQNGEVYPA